MPRPNVAYAFEHKGHFVKERGHYQTHVVRDGATHPVPTAAHCKSPGFGAFTSYAHHGRFVSFVGDTHPDFNGNVVKAVASGSRVYPKIVEVFGTRAQARGDTRELAGFHARMSDLFRAEVVAVTRLADDVIELTVRAPMAARRFQPGQFFRLQNFESSAPLLAGTRLHTEPLALAGARVDAERGTVSMIVFERGASSRLVATPETRRAGIVDGPHRRVHPRRPCRRHHPAHRRPAGRRHSARDRPSLGAPPARACSTSPCSRANKMFFCALPSKPPPTTLSGASAATGRSSPAALATASSAARSPPF